MINHPDCAYMDWGKSIVGPDYKTNIKNNSAKMQVLMEIIRESVLLGEKVLVFSCSINTLDVIETLLNSILLFLSFLPSSFSSSFFPPIPFFLFLSLLCFLVNF